MKKVIGVLLSLVLLITICGCSNAKNSFEDFSITEKGVFKWNAIKEAKYYYVEDSWTEKTSYDVSSLIEEENGSVIVTVEAFKSKSLFGILEVEPLTEKIVKQKGKFYLEEDATKYNVTYNFTNTVTDEEFQFTNVNSYVLASVPTVASKEAKATFSGWYSDSEFTNKFDMKNYYLTEDMTLYGRMEIRKLTVTIYGNYEDTEIVETKQIEYGSELVEADMPNYIRKEGYSFICWVYYSYGNKYNVSFPLEITENTEIYAGFRENPTITIYSDYAGKQVAVTKTVPVGTVLNESDMPAYTYREGYSFVGWAASTGWYNRNEKITFPYTVENSVEIRPTFTKNN